MEERTFPFLVERYGHLLEGESSHLWRTIVVEKRLTVLLYYLARSDPYYQVGALFHVGTRILALIVQSGVQALLLSAVQDSIIFPTG